VGYESRGVSLGKKEKLDETIIPPEDIKEIPNTPEGKPQKVDGIKVQKQLFSKHQILYIGGGVACAIVAIVSLLLYGTNNQSIIFAVMAIAGGTGAVLFIRKSFNRDGGALVAINGKIAQKKTQSDKVNTLSIWGKLNEKTQKVEAERVEFVWCDEPLGQPWQCENTGQYYYVQIWDKDTKAMKAFDLPDTKFVDPVIMARYLELPAQRKYLKYRDTLMKYISYAILGILVGAGFITIIAIA
jgi:hypothetical protein